MNKLGWNLFFEKNFEPFKNQNYHAMRVVRENRGQYLLMNPQGEFAGEVTGKFRFESASRKDFPVVGDWVIARLLNREDRALIHGILPRKSLFSRKTAGDLTEEQPIAANLDTIFIVTGLDENYNLRRIERYLTLVFESGAMPVVLLNKGDLCSQAEERLLEVQLASPGVDAYVVSAKNPETFFSSIEKYLKPGKTSAFIGSSGVGKSTLINLILKEEKLKTREVSSFSLGQHTTTFRQLFFLMNDAMVIDTPGMREVGIWGEEENLSQVFDEILDLARSCRFSDCRHEQEPGCAVKKAVDSGILDEKRLESYRKLKKEYAYLELRQNLSSNAVEKLRWKEISLMTRKFKKEQD